MRKVLTLALGAPCTPLRWGSAGVSGIKTRGLSPAPRVSTDTKSEGQGGSWVNKCPSQPSQSPCLAQGPFWTFMALLGILETQPSRGSLQVIRVITAHGEMHEGYFFYAVEAPRAYTALTCTIFMPVPQGRQREPAWGELWKILKDFP